MPTATVTMEGHIIDSLALPKVWDTIMDLGGSFDVEEIRVGKRKNEKSFARMSVQARSEARLNEILGALQPLGATPIDQVDARLPLLPLPP